MRRSRSSSVAVRRQMGRLVAGCRSRPAATAQAPGTDVLGEAAAARAPAVNAVTLGWCVSRRRVVLAVADRRRDDPRSRAAEPTGFRGSVAVEAPVVRRRLLPLRAALI